MTIDDIKTRLHQERNFGSRFPARIIFAENFNAYRELVNQLKGICDVTFNVADFCRACDTVPQFDRIRDKLSDCSDKHVLLMSVGEYLRLCIKRELDAERCQFRAFWEMHQPEYSKTRVIMPVFSCREIFDRIIGNADERQQNFMWTLESARADKIYNVAVYSPKFASALEVDADNLSAWLRDWENIFLRKTDCAIITLHCRNVETICGAINIQPVDSPFRYLMNVLIDGDKLVDNWATDDFWSRVVKFAAEFPAKVSFAKIVVAALNVNEFDFVQVVARWQTLNNFQKVLVWIWYRVYPARNYFSHACNKAVTADDIPNRIRDEILLIDNRSDAWISERMTAMNALNFTTYDAAYFALMDKLLPQTKLKLLTYRTHAEKTYAVKVISEFLRGGAEEIAVAEMIREFYPALTAYMQERNDCDAEIDAYMAWYRKSKLINRYREDFPDAGTFERFDARYKLMQKFATDDGINFWIDGFGIEYAPLFIFELRKRNIVPDLIATTLALLPTDTKYNRQWTERDLKWDRLDALSHNGTPDDKSYYSCIVNQLDFFADAAEMVETLLEKNNRVIITGDHGSSRMAALAFHDVGVVPITAPNNSTVHNFGRFCELDETYADMNALPETVKITSTLANKICLVMNTYRHFSARGNVAGGNSDERDVVGEIHGGNTPEERLVPVIVVKRKVPLPKIICTPQNRHVRKIAGRVETNLKFNRAISSLEVYLGNNAAICTENPDGSWRIILNGVDTDEINLSIVADGKLLDVLSLQIKSRGITINDDPFGGVNL